MNRCQEFSLSSHHVPPVSLNFTDQYAFRPTGSTTAAIVAIWHLITDVLYSNPYVVILALDFSKASDTVRHATLLQKIALLDIPDAVYNLAGQLFLGMKALYAVWNLHIRNLEVYRL